MDSLELILSSILIAIFHHHHHNRHVVLIVYILKKSILSSIHFDHCSWQIMTTSCLCTELMNASPSLSAYTDVSICKIPSKNVAFVWSFFFSCANISCSFYFDCFSSCCFVGYCLLDLFETTHTIFVQFSSSFFLSVPH